MTEGYPQADEDDFEGRLYRDARYYQGLENPLPPQTREGGTFQPMEQQIQVPRYLCPETGTRGGLIAQNVGCGKTGTGLCCAMRYTWLKGMKPTVILVSETDEMLFCFCATRLTQKLFFVGTE